MRGLALVISLLLAGCGIGSETQPPPDAGSGTNVEVQTLAGSVSTETVFAPAPPETGTAQFETATLPEGSSFSTGDNIIIPAEVLADGREIYIGPARASSAQEPPQAEQAITIAPAFTLPECFLNFEEAVDAANAYLADHPDPSAVPYEYLDETFLSRVCAESK